MAKPFVKLHEKKLTSGIYTLCLNKKEPQHYRL